MDFILKRAKLSFLALIICFSFAGCDEDDQFRPGEQVVTPQPEPEPEPTDDNGTESNTIIDFVSDDENYSSFVAAVEAAGQTATLSGDTNYTVFAPDNDAFTAFLSDNGFENLEAVPEDLLANIIMNHIQEGISMSADFSTGYIESMAEAGPDGENVSLYINTEDGVMLNGISTVVSADNEVDNGVVHTVDAVIGLPDVTTFATADATFSTLATGLTNEELVGTLQSSESPAPFTIFAPTDDAFTAFLADLEVGSLAEIGSETLTEVLEYHVIIDDNLTSDELTDGATVTTFQGQDLTINVDGDGVITLTDATGATATVITEDIQATNGVIHAIDIVIMPDLTDGDG